MRDGSLWLKNMTGVVVAEDNAFHKNVRCVVLVPGVSGVHACPACITLRTYVFSTVVPVTMQGRAASACCESGNNMFDGMCREHCVLSDAQASNVIVFYGDSITGCCL